jgi:hypothetical protein
MKRRNGYVANSSASSYVVKLYIDEYSSIYETIVEELEEYFNIDNIVATIEEDIKRADEERKKYNRLKKINTETINEKTLLLDEIKYLESYGLTKFLLTEYYNIEITENDHYIEMVHVTSMHNSYNDMSNVLKDIVLYYIMETDIKIECERVDKS